MANGFDCTVKLTLDKAKVLKAKGYEYVARYLGTNWKTFNADEVKVIQEAGLKLISVFEKNPTNASYFTEAQGIMDAKQAMEYAAAVNQPKGSAIYFTVDYDAQPVHMKAILNYLNGVKSTLKDYKIGLYGSHDVMQAFKGQVDYYWQTYAWSKGKVADHIHMHQFQNGVTVEGIELDRNDIKKEPGSWMTTAKPHNMEAKPKVKEDSKKSLFKTIQKTVNSRYGFHIAVDGIPGPETLTALLKAYQKELNKQFDAHLVVDGKWGPKTADATESIRIGATGNITWIAQVLLYIAGYDPNGLDSVFGNGMAKAVLSFQKAKHIIQDGIIGKQTFEKLFSA